MKFLNIFTFMLIMGVELHSEGAPVKRLFQDVKLPTQKVVEAQAWTAPVASGTNIVITDSDGPSSAATVTISSFAAQPDFPRTLIVKATASSVDLSTCAVVVNGTNYNGHVISETFNFAYQVLSAPVGSKAFKTVTSVVFPASCEQLNFRTHWSVGVDNRLGLKRCMTNAGDDIKDLLDGAKAATLGVYAADTDEVEKNTFLPNTAPNASHNYQSYFMQDYICF